MSTRHYGQLGATNMFPVIWSLLELDVAVTMIGIEESPDATAVFRVTVIWFPLNEMSRPGDVAVAV